MDLLKNPLSDKYTSVKCHSTADLFKDESIIDGKSAEERRNELFNSPFLKKLHNKTQDTTAALVELSNIIIDEPTPDAIGLDLVKRVNLGTATKKVRIREPAITAATGRARAARGRGSRSRYIELKPETEEESHSSWDLSFLEDADWSVAMEETAAISKDIQEKISQIIINKLVSSAGSSTASIGTLDFTTLVNTRKDLMLKHIRPNSLLVDPTYMADLLVTDQFQNGYLYGDIVNKREGYMGRFLGMDVYESSQMPVSTAIVMQKENYMLYGVRRDMMLNSYEEFENGKTKYGVCVSSRFDLKVGLSSFAHKITT